MTPLILILIAGISSLIYIPCILLITMEYLSAKKKDQIYYDFVNSHSFKD